MLVYNSN